jgi:hypothetical protein
MPLASMFSAAADAAATPRYAFSITPPCRRFQLDAMCAMLITPPPRTFADARRIARHAMSAASFATPCCRYASGMLALRRRRYSFACRQPRHAAARAAPRQYAYRFARRLLRFAPPAATAAQATPPKMIPAAMLTPGLRYFR